MTATMTTADLPETMRSNVAALAPTATTPVLTCQHGPACPACVLSTARVLIGADAALVGPGAYTG